MLVVCLLSFKFSFAKSLKKNKNEAVLKEQMKTVWWQNFCWALLHEDITIHVSLHYLRYQPSPVSFTAWDGLALGRLEAVGHGTGVVHPWLNSGGETATQHSYHPWQHTWTKPFVLGTASFLGEDKRDEANVPGQEYWRALKVLLLRQENAARGDIVNFCSVREAILSCS